MRRQWIFLRPPDDRWLTLGEHDNGDRWDGVTLWLTRSPERAQSWARELRAGRPPVDDYSADPLKVARYWQPELPAGTAPLDDVRAPDSLH